MDDDDDGSLSSGTFIVYLMQAMCWRHINDAMSRMYKTGSW